MALQPNIGALAGQQSPIQMEQDPSPEGVAVRKQKWSEFFANPQVQAALLQFGVSALQPRAPGQSTGGAIASAVGQGAQAATRVGAAETARTQQALKTEQEATRIGLEERRTAAGERTAAAGERRVGIAEQQASTAQKRLDVQVDQFTRRLQQEFKIEGDKAANKALLELIKQETQITTDSFGDHLFDMDAVRSRFADFMSIRAGEPAAPEAGNLSGETPEQIAGRLKGFTTPDEIAAATERALAAGVSQETVDTALALNAGSVAEVLDEEKAKDVSGFDSSKKLALDKLEASLRVKVIGDPKLRKEEKTRGAVAKEKALPEFQAFFPNGLEGITKEEADFIRSRPELSALLEEAFPRKKEGQSNMNWLRAKFAAERKASRGAR